MSFQLLKTYGCLGLTVAILFFVSISAEAAITQVGQYDVGQGINGPDTSAIEVCVIGDYAYVCAIEGLATFDVSDPNNIYKVYWTDAPSPNWSTIEYVGDGFLYLTCTTGGFHTISLANPAAPEYLATLDPSGAGAANVSVHGNYAYVAYNNQNTKVIEMSADRRTLSLYWALTGGDNVKGIDNDGTYVYLACGAAGLKIRTIASLLARTNVPTSTIDFGNQVATNVKVVGNWAFVSCGADGIYVVDITNKAAPVLHATNNTAGSAVYADVVGSFLYVADEAGGLKVFDISGLPFGDAPPYALNLTDSFDPNGNPAETYRGLCATNGFVYVADRYQGLRILNAGTRNMSMQRSYPRMQYRMIGIPTTTTTGDAAALFGDNFANAAPGSPRWRLSRWNDATQTYIRYQEPAGDPEPPALAPGKGFWLQQDAVSNCVLDITVAQNNGIINQGANYSVSLEPGRNPNSFSQVANPFHYPYNLATTIFNVSGGVGDLLWSAAAVGNYINGNAYVWDGTQYVTIPFNQYIKPWTGFWVIQTDYTKSINILFPPRDGYAGVSPPPKSDEPPKLSNEDSWTLELPIISTDSEFRDEYNRIGIGENYADVYDPCDAFELSPMTPQYVHLYFPHEDWEAQPANYTFDYRSGDFGVTNTKIWDMTVQTCRLPNTDFVIRWPNIDQIPENYSISLVELESGSVLADLRHQDNYVLSVGDQDLTTLSYRIVVSKNPDVVGDEPQPATFDLLSAYPNPFNATTQISYNLSASENIKLEIFDATGRWITTIQEGPQSIGIHRVEWNSETYAPGLYVCRLKAGTIETSLKLTLVK